MNQHQVKKSLAKLPLARIKYFESTGSTNDEALAWAANDAGDLSLVVADAQTAGRGRLDRKWFTPAGTALAFSLILRPSTDEQRHLSRMVGLAALSIADALQKRGLSPRVKWPNDVLLNGRKVAGVLIESVWSGEQVDYVVMGMGVNTLKGSVPEGEVLQFPATSLEDTLGHPVERAEVLKDILVALIRLRPQLGTDPFMTKWEDLLAFRGEQVQVQEGKSVPIAGKLLGLASDGSLKLGDENKQSWTVQFGDVRLRPTA